jgi:ABC-type branched-subunit amino acid transport system substrate-binding protein
MMKERGRKRIAMFYTDNPLGYEYLDAAKEYLKALGKELVAEEKCKEADFDMSSQALKLKKSEADCVVVGATIGTSVKIIKAMHQIGYYPEIMGTMMLGNPGFIEVAGKESEGVFMTMTGLAFTSKTLDPYRELAKKYFPDKPFDNSISAGICHIYVFAEALRRAGKDLTREKFIKAVETINNKDFYIPFFEGANFYYSAKKHNGTSSVIIGQVIRGRIEQVTNWIDWKDMPVPEVEGN